MSEAVTTNNAPRDGAALFFRDPKEWGQYTDPDDVEPVPGHPHLLRVKPIMRWRRKYIRSTEYGYA